MSWQSGKIEKTSSQT